MDSEIRRPFFSEFAYSGCALVWSVLGEYYGGSIFDYIDVDKLKKPSKNTVLHDFIGGVYDFVIGETFYDYPELEIETYSDIVKKAGLSFPEGVFDKIKHGDYEHGDKEVAFEVIINAVYIIEIPSVFNILFSDRNFIQSFQMEIRKALLRDGDGAPERYAGVYLPAWLKKGIFYRDRGRCQICNKDLSGIFSPGVDCHIDHIIPLADFGNNDPTNFQLTCSACNLKKAKKTDIRRSEFVAYWIEE